MCVGWFLICVSVALLHVFLLQVSAAQMCLELVSGRLKQLDDDISNIDEFMAANQAQVQPQRYPQPSTLINPKPGPLNPQPSTLINLTLNPDYPET